MDAVILLLTFLITFIVVGVAMVAGGEKAIHELWCPGGLSHIKDPGYFLFLEDLLSGRPSAYPPRATNCMAVLWGTPIVSGILVVILLRGLWGPRGGHYPEAQEAEEMVN